MDNLIQLVPNSSSIAGPLTTGHYVQIGMGLGFYVPENEFQRLQLLADTTHRVQFLGITRNGQPLFGSRDEISNNPDSAGLIAWIVPRELPPHKHTCPMCHQTLTCNNPCNCPGIGKDAKCGAC